MPEEVQAVEMASAAGENFGIVKGKEKHEVVVDDEPHEKHPIELRYFSPATPRRKGAEICLEDLIKKVEDDDATWFSYRKQYKQLFDEDGTVKQRLVSNSRTSGFGDQPQSPTGKTKFAHRADKSAERGRKEEKHKEGRASSNTSASRKNMAQKEQENKESNIRCESKDNKYSAGEDFESRNKSNDATEQGQTEMRSLTRRTLSSSALRAALSRRSPSPSLNPRREPSQQQQPSCAREEPQYLSSSGSRSNFLQRTASWTPHPPKEPKEPHPPKEPRSQLREDKKSRDAASEKKSSSSRCSEKREDKKKEPLAPLKNARKPSQERAGRISLKSSSSIPLNTFLSKKTSTERVLEMFGKRTVKTPSSTTRLTRRPKMDK